MLPVLGFLVKSKNKLPWILLGCTFVVLSTIYFLLNREKEYLREANKQIGEYKATIEQKDKEIKEKEEEIAKMVEVQRAYEEVAAKMAKDIETAHLEHMSIKNNLDDEENSILSNPDNYQIARDDSELEYTFTTPVVAEDTGNNSNTHPSPVKVLKKDAASKVSEKRSNAMWQSYCKVNPNDPECK